VNWFAPIRQAVQRTVGSAMERWPARIIIGTTAGFLRVQIFDRAMTIAAQAFTSIFPTLILLSALAGRNASAEVADVADLPEASRQVLDDALRGGGLGAFGVAGAVVVLISATSLSRALARAYAIIWQLPKLPRGLAMSWRWLVTVLLLVVFLIGSRLIGWVTGQLPLSDASSAIILLLADVGIAVLVPWLVLGGLVPQRLLLPGGCVFGLVMLVLRPVGAVYLPRALATSGERYGPIGHAFTYVSWLYVISFALLGTAVLGQVLAEDDGTIGWLVRGPRPRFVVREPGLDPDVDTDGGDVLVHPAEQEHGPDVGVGGPERVDAPGPQPGVVDGGDLGGIHQRPADEVEQREDGGHDRETAVDRPGPGR